MIYNQNKEITYSIILFSIPMIALFSIYFLSKANQSVLTDHEPIQKTAAIVDYKKLNNPFSKIEIEAKAAIVQNLNTGEIIYQKNANLSLPLASITKVMTALTGYTLVQNPNYPVIITASALATDGDNFLSLGERFKLKHILDFTLMSSSNDAAAAIAQAVVKFDDEPNEFVRQMNYIAKQIGMNDTYFLNETGLDEDLNKAGSFGSAKDVATMFGFILKNYPDLLEKTKDINLAQYSESGILHQATNTNEIIPKLKNILASKTGYTDLAGGNLAVVIDPGLNTPIAIVVLGSTHKGRFTDVLKLSETLQEYFNYQN